MNKMDKLHTERAGGYQPSNTETFWEKIGFFVMLITCLMTPSAIMFHNPEYLYSPTGFADGGDMYSHIAEAFHLKELLENYTTDFWFHQVSLGYPMFTAYQPLPCVLISTIMIFLQRLLSPLLVFRLVFVAVLTLIPFTFYKSAKLFGMKPMQGIFLCLLVFAVQSWRKFGLEISAFVEYGLLTQAFGMLLLPLAVSSFYNWIFNTENDTKASTVTFIILAVVFLCNFFFGIFSCVLSAVMLFVKIVNKSDRGSFFPVGRLLCKFINVHLHWLFLISWWFLGCLAGYKYIGGLPWRTDSEDGYPFMFIVSMFMNGEFFDSQRVFPWLTILVLLGFTVNNLNLAPNKLCIRSCTLKDRMFSSWLILSSFVSVLLFLGRTTFSVFYNLIPFHTELETVKYLNAIHFCGLLHASAALCEIFSTLSETVIHIISGYHFEDYLSKISQIVHNTCPFSAVIRVFLPLQKHTIRTMLLIVVAFPLWLNHFSTIGTQLTMTEVNQNFVNGLQILRNSSLEGRIFGHKALGSARSWDLAFVPSLTGKPGLMTYSRGYHDSLSIFYLESLTFRPEKAQMFVAMLRLYNVHFLATSLHELDQHFMEACQMKHLSTVDDLVFYELLHEDPDYGYFDFVRIPGYIQGDLKLMRETVLKTLDLYSINSALMINPHESFDSDQTVVINVKNSAWWNDWKNFTQQKVLVTWSWKNQQNDSQHVMDEIFRENSWKWIYSQVIEERVNGVEYQAIIQVSDRGFDINDQEHLLLKVTYHPFWKCYYYRVSDDFSLSMFKQSSFMDGKRYTAINHVTPNMMLVSLPPGRYLVVFTYRYPGILKILAFVCIACFIFTLKNLLWRKKVDQKQKLLQVDGHLKKSEKDTIILTELYDNSKLDVDNVLEINENSSEEIEGNSIGGSDLKLHDDSRSSWKIKGRLRSYSIAAESRFNSDAVNFLLNNPEARTLHTLPSYSEVVDDMVEATEHSTEPEMTNEQAFMKHVADKDDDETDSDSHTSMNNLLSDDSTLISRMNSDQPSCKQRDPSMISSSEDDRNINETIDNNNGPLLCPSTSNDGDAMQKGNSSLLSDVEYRKVPDMGKKLIDLQLDKKEDSVMNLRERLQKLHESNRESYDDSKYNNSAMVKQLRTTYVRQRRNTLSALPALRK